MVSRLQCREVCRTWRSSFPKPNKGLLYEISHLKGTDEFEAQIYFSEQNNYKVSTNPVDGNDDLGYLGTLTKLRHGLIRPSSPSEIQSCIAGSCNGLVCYAGFANGFTRIVYIRNPVTGEQIQVPTMDECDYVPCKEKTIGFGYNSSSDEYKVVRLMHHYLCTEGTVRVYTLQAGTGWRKTVSKIRESVFSQLRFSVSAGIFAGGALHWIDECSIRSKIVAFDLKNEKFKLLPSIPSVFHGANHVTLMVLGGNLCVLEVVPSKNVTIWEYAQKLGTSAHKRRTYGQKRRRHASPWAAKFSIPWEDYGWLEPFGLHKCLLWYNAILSCYDPETKTLRKLDETLKKLMDDYAASSIYTTNRATPHVHSLVSLKEIMEERVGKKRKALDEA